MRQPELHDFPTKPRTRKDASGQQKVINLDVLRERIDELETLEHAAREAKEALGDAIKQTATDTGLMASVVRSFVKARVDDTVSDRKRNADQLSLVFEEVVE